MIALKPSLVGRKAELDSLRRWSSSVEAGQTIVAVVHGDPGIGKTRLVESLIAELSGWSVIHVTGDEAERRLPYALLEQLTDILERSQGRRDPQLHPWRQHGVDPLTAGAALVQIFGGTPVGLPTALLVDDVGWADQQSLQALSFAVRRLTLDRLFAVFTVRSEDIHRIPEGLQRMAAAADCVLPLGGLSVDQIMELAIGLGHHPPARRDAVRLRAHTGGNPLYLQSWLDDAAAGEVAYGREDLPAPRAFAARIARTLGTADPAVQRLIRSAAVLGMRAPLTLAGRAAGVADSLQALEDAGPLGLVDGVREPVGWVVVFRHPLIKAAVYGTIGPATRKRLHTRAAGLVDGPRSLDHLVAAATPPDLNLAERLAAQALADQRTGYWGLAADRFVAAARLTPDPERRTAWLLEAFDQLLAAGEVWDASRLEPQLRTLSVSGRQRLKRRLLQARFAWLQGLHDAAAALVEPVWHDLAVSTAERADAANLLGQISVLADDGAAATYWAELAAPLDQPAEGQSWSRLTRALGLAISGDPEAGLTALDLPVNPAEVPVARMDEFWTRGWIRLWCEDPSGAYQDLRERSTDLDGWALTPYGLIRLGYLAQAEYRLGAWDDAASHALAAATLIADTDQTWLSAFGHSQPVFVLAARGEWDEAANYVSRAQQAADSVGDRAGLNHAANASVHLAACRSDHRGVIAAAAPLRSTTGGASQVPGIFSWHTECASALIADGRMDEARQILDRLSAQAERRQLRSSRAAIARVRGELAAAVRDPALARQFFLQAEQLGADGPEKFDQARAWLAHAAFLRRIGQRRAAAERLRAASNTFELLGAIPFLDRCSEELAACGFPAESSSDQREHRRLTPQELAVARLVSAGRTNKEVAAQLVLSVKTVGYHLSNAYNKYGVRSRTELAGILLRDATQDRAVAG